MTSFLRLIQSYFHRAESEVDIDAHVTFDEGNTGGFPSDIVAFNYNSSNGLLVIATYCNEIKFYGYQGATWSYNLTEINATNFPSGSISKLCFLSSKTVLALCRGPSLVLIKFEDGILKVSGVLSYEETRFFDWDVHHVQTFANESNALIFYFNESVFRVKENLKSEKLIPTSDIQIWCPLDSDLSSITSVPQKPDVLILLTTQGVVGVYRNAQFLAKFELRNFEDEPLLKIFWSPVKNEAYGISTNNKYTKWYISVEVDGKLNAQEIDTCNSNKFGPYPCHKIRHFSVCTCKTEEFSNIIVYQGGRSSGKHDDRDVISISHKGIVEKFELASEVIGIASVNNSYDGDSKNGVVLICTKCEIIGIDMNEKEMKVLQPTSFFSINNSNPTSHSAIIDIEENVWNRLETVSKAYWAANQMSARTWPLFFQKERVVDANFHRASIRQVYISGHSNGNICIWKNGGVNMSLILVIRTSLEFEQNYLLENQNVDLREKRGKSESKIKKIGFYDPFDDDEELCITRIHLDKKTGILIATNRGGYIFTYELSENTCVIPMWNLLPVLVDRTDYDAKNSPQVRQSDLKYSPGYQPRRTTNNTSPIAFFVPLNYRITEVAYLHKHSCLAVGSTKGVAFLDVEHGHLVHSNEFHNKQENAIDQGTNQLQRFKSFKKSLRKTFRRKKRGDAQSSVCNLTKVEKNGIVPETIQSDFFERQIIAQVEKEAVNSSKRTFGSVTCLQMLRFPLLEMDHVDDVIAVGVNEGDVYFFTIVAYDDALRTTFQTELIKKLSLHHRQPILSVNITNEEGYFCTSTRLVVLTTEQIRIYQCHPLLKRDSYKLTALEGLKIKNGTVSKFSNKKNNTNFGSFIVLLANNGTIRIHSFSKPSQFFTIEFIDPSNSLAMNSTCLTKDGSIYYLMRSSELKRSTINSNSRDLKLLKDI